MTNYKEIVSSKNDKEENLNLCFMKSQKLLTENAEKSQLIIQYQARIMAMRDEQDLTEKDMAVLKMKNSSLMQKLKDLKTDYDWQRSCSMRLSEQVDQSKDQLKQERLSSKKLFALQLELARVTEEKDAALDRVKEFREVMTALNVKYDILHKEKYKEAEKRGQVGLLTIDVFFFD